MGTPREDLAEKLREARVNSGYGSQAALAARLNVTRSVITKAENAGHAVPSTEVLTAWAGITGAPLDVLTELAERTKSGFPEWFMPYRLAEAAAAVLRVWSPIVVPAILQTEGYARAQLSVESYTPGRLDELVGARLERQDVIGRAHITAIIDDLVLRRCVGSPAIMAEQCGHLATMGERADTAVHVIPEGTNMGLWGAFDLASRGPVVTVCLSAIEDIPSTSEGLTSKTALAFEQLLGAACPRGMTMSLVRKAEEEWKTRI
jgi:transcriptional regulator with XRE-family HTH domain